MSMMSVQDLRRECTERVDYMVNEAKQDLKQSLLIQANDKMHQAMDLLRPHIVGTLEILLATNPGDERIREIDQAARKWLKGFFELNEVYMRKSPRSRLASLECQCRSHETDIIQPIAKKASVMSQTESPSKTTLRSMSFMNRTPLERNHVIIRLMKAIDRGVKTNELALLLDLLETKLRQDVTLRVYDLYNQRIVDPSSQVNFVYSFKECQRFPEEILEPDVFREALRETLCQVIRSKGSHFSDQIFYRIYEQLRVHQDEYPEVLQGGRHLGLDYAPYYLLANRGRALANALEEVFEINNR